MNKQQRNKQLICRGIATSILVASVIVNIPLGIHIFTNCPNVETPEEKTIEEIKNDEFGFNPVISIAVKPSTVSEVKKQFILEHFEISTEQVEVVAEAIEETEIESEETEVAEEETTANTTKKKSYTNDDLERLAHLIWCEAGGNSKTDIKAMQYTGSIVLNRVKSKRFPNSIKGVISEKNQYGVASYYMKKTPSKKAYEVAKDLLENGSKLPSDYFLQAGSKTFQKYGDKKRYVKVGKIYFSALKK